MRNRTLVYACALSVSFGLLGVPTASAITWDFSTGGAPDGTSEPFTVGGVTLIADGFSSATALAAGTPNVNLFSKTGAGDERGLGLVNDTAGENEISLGSQPGGGSPAPSIVRINMTAAGFIPVITFQMDSTTNGETWLVQGSNSPTSGFVPLLTGTDELVSHGLPFFNFYTFQAVQNIPLTVSNVLLASITAVPGPIVGAGLPGLIAGCAGLVALARRRRQRLA
jgi:hypothetical protein